MGRTSYQGSISVCVRDTYDDKEWQELQDLQQELASDLEALELKYAKVSLMVSVPEFA